MRYFCLDAIWESIKELIPLIQISRIVRCVTWYVSDKPGAAFEANEMWCCSHGWILSAYDA